jgi:K+-transporting ATPase ATPase C chain
MTEPGDSGTESREIVPPSAPPASLRRQFWPALLSVPLLTLVTGIVFPLVLTALARPVFPSQADGSLVSPDGLVVGSHLIGQGFSGPGYFHPRPSAAGNGYDATASGGTNLGPANPKLLNGAPRDPVAGGEPYVGVRQLADDYRRRNDLPPDAVVPMDAVTRSGSGLDQHISPANAQLQIGRIARVRVLSEEAVRHLVAEHTEGKQLGFLGEPRVSVLALNLALDRIAPLPGVPPER